MKTKKILSGLLLTLCFALLGNSLSARAEEKESWPKGPEIAGGSAIVMDVNSGTVLYEKNAHEKLYPASITKILTALLAVENSEMDEQVTFSYDAVHKTEGSGIWRDVDEVMTMEQCLYALMLNSANECAYAIAEHTGGSYENFVKMMNDRAKALGCKNTNFNNPHGLPDEKHYTSSYDMALISREAMKNETFRELTGTKRYQIPPTNKHPDEITYLKNHQKMMFEGEEYYYEYCIGGKTGYTQAAGSTLVTYAEKDGMTLVCVVMKEERPNQFTDTIALLDYCFDNFRSYNIAENMDSVEKNQTPRDRFLFQEAFAGIDKNAAVMLPVGVDFDRTAMEIVYDETKKNTPGTLEFTYADRVVGSAHIEKIVKELKPYPFAEQNRMESKGDTKVIRISVWMIVLVILGIGALGATGFGLYKFKDNFYILRYRLKTWWKRAWETEGFPGQAWEGEALSDTVGWMCWIGREEGEEGKK